MRLQPVNRLYYIILFFFFFFFFFVFLVFPGQLTKLYLIVMSLFLLLCCINQNEASEIIQRLNYGVVFNEEAKLHRKLAPFISNTDTKKDKHPKVKHKDNNTCLLIAQMLSQINDFRSETALRLNNTIKTVRRLVPETVMRNSRSERA